jgi:hypothetical protein
LFTQRRQNSRVSFDLITDRKSGKTIGRKSAHCLIARSNPEVIGHGCTGKEFWFAAIHLGVTKGNILDPNVLFFRQECIRPLSSTTVAWLLTAQV